MTNFERAGMRRYCTGGFSTWAKTLALMGADALFKSRSLAPTWSSLNEGLPFVIIPQPSLNKVAFTTLYGPKLSHLNAPFLAKLAELEPTMVTDWRRYCKAYVQSMIDLTLEHPFYCLGHNGTAKAADWLYCPQFVADTDQFFHDDLIDPAVEYVQAFHATQMNYPLDERIARYVNDEFYKP